MGVRRHKKDTLIQNHMLMCAVSLLESREQRYIKAMNNNNKTSRLVYTCPFSLHRCVRVLREDLHGGTRDPAPGRGPGAQRPDGGPHGLRLPEQPERTRRGQPQHEPRPATGGGGQGVGADGHRILRGRVLRTVPHQLLWRLGSVRLRTRSH